MSIALLEPAITTGAILLPMPRGLRTIDVTPRTSSRRPRHLRPFATGNETPLSAYVHVANDDAYQLPRLGVSRGERLLSAGTALAASVALTVATLAWLVLR